MSAIAAVVLAAGASRRLGEPKQMVRIDEETLLERTVRVALEADLEPVYVVVSGDQDFEFGVGKLANCSPLINDSAVEGMASSIRVGVAAAAERAAGVVLLACDQPAVTAEHLRELIAEQDEIAGSEYAGRRGVPAYFPASEFPMLMELKGDVGARELLKGVKCIALPNGEVDVDTPDDLRLARGLFTARAISVDTTPK